MKHLSALFIWSGILFALLGAIILLATFLPVGVLELRYLLFRPNANVIVTNAQKAPKYALRPINDQFGIVIPKIDANATIVPSVDPYNAAIYQVALTKGVAQAKGTALPYEKGNMFLFSHSSVNFYEATMYNSIFYLLSKMEKGDSIYIFYKGTKYTYKVTGKNLVNPQNVSYLSQVTGTPTLTLMTCWPAGTSLQRLLVFASQTTAK